MPQSETKEMDELRYLDGLATVPRRAGVPTIEVKRKENTRRQHTKHPWRPVQCARGQPQSVQTLGAKLERRASPGPGRTDLRRTLGTSSSWYPQRRVRGDGPPVVVLGYRRNGQLGRLVSLPHAQELP